MNAQSQSARTPQQLLALVRAQPGQRARELAQALGLDKTTVNRWLHGELAREVEADREYRWHPRAANRPRTAAVPREAPTALNRLAAYYLECLSRDDLGGVSVFQTNRYGLPDYAEVPGVPLADPEAPEPLSTDAGRTLYGRARRDRNRQEFYLGYPVRLRKMVSRKSDWEGLMVEPLLLVPYEAPEVPGGRPELTAEPPQWNLAALKAMSHGSEASLMEEVAQLNEELGLDGLNAPDLDDLVARLHQLRPDWDWQEEPLPTALTMNPPLERLTREGIYNRAVLVMAERSAYTRGLEAELKALQTVSPEACRATALGRWLEPTLAAPPAGPELGLIETVPLNTEQRQAVQQALQNPLTVITGPPGTGKSQVVTSILVNAAWQGKTVLFASKNHKAVDVVETRVNALGSRPVLLRLGPNKYQAKLAEYLTALLAASTTPADEAHYRETRAQHEQGIAMLAHNEAEAQALIELRNRVDLLEQGVETARELLGPSRFAAALSWDTTELRGLAVELGVTADAADVRKQGWWTRLRWRWLAPARLARLAQVGETARVAAEQANLTLAEPPAGAAAVLFWRKAQAGLVARAELVEQVREYQVALAELSERTPLEALNARRVTLTEELATNAAALWQAWVRLQPGRMTQAQRKLVGDYASLLQMIISANESNQRVSRDVFRRYYALFPQVMPVLPCWGVTSLSARGRVPFEPNFVDLVVIDEASQCDIASALPLLYRARQAVVIGDPMQLRHISSLPRQQDQLLLQKHDLLTDFPGWAYSCRSLFDLASSLCRSEDIIALRDHHRSHADIIGFSNEAFYEGRLRVATHYDRLRRPTQEGPAVRWVHVNGQTTRPGSGGALNEREAREVVRELERLVAQGYRGTVGVVSPFRAQANRINDLVQQSDALQGLLGPLDFLADTVHKFQGDERDLLLFSPVISAGAPAGALAFLRQNANLFNVAVTRARAALVVVGDRQAALNSEVDYLARFATYVEALHRPAGTGAAATQEDLGPEYPSVACAELVSDWERMFYRQLYAAGIRTIPQYAVEKYLLDLALVAGARRLDIEIDGERYHRNWDGELCRRDQLRNQRLIELGWDVMRFWVYQIRDEPEACIARVQRWLARADG